MQYYTTELLSANQELTPEGFLLAKNVPIARTGVMLYLASEVQVDGDSDGIVRVERTADQVFADATIASFNGKPVTLDHPAVGVNPQNWASLAKGIVQNPRRGTGIEDDFLVADLLITDAAAIKEIRDGLREVSCGYDADYEQIEPGRARQLNIVGNHLALVDKGRCGPRCAIGDSMKITFFDRLRAAFKARDEKAFEDCMKDAETEETEEEKKKRDEAEEEKKTSDTMIALDGLLKRVEALEARDKKAADESEKEEEEKKEKKDDEEEEKEEKTKDSASLRDEAQDVFARVEILSPGLQLPTFDAKADKQKTLDALCALKRKALENAFNGKHKAAVKPFVGATADFSQLTCDQLNYALIGASEIVRIKNNADGGGKVIAFDASKSASAMASKITEINRANKEFWHRQ